MSSIIQDSSLEEYSKLARRHHLLHVRVTSHYKKLVREEVDALGHTGGPLYKVAYPTTVRFEVRAPGEVNDFVQDRSNMPDALADMAVHKYDNRLLFLLTDKCAGHCMYCFRQDVLSEQHDKDLPAYQIKIDSLVSYLQQRPEVTEVILSGGDPLTVPIKYLRETFARLKNETSVTDLRVHTRNVVFSPRSINAQLCKTLGEYDVRLVIHIVHPYELDAEVENAIRCAQSYGVRCYSQFPVLRGINDHPVVLEQLLRALDELQVRPLSLFVADPINYSSIFRISMTRLLAIIDELNWRNASWINSVRLVLDTPIGKVRRENIVGWERASNLITFLRQGKTVVYPDFPEELDEPGLLNVMLWKQG